MSAGAAVARGEEIPAPQVAVEDGGGRRRGEEVAEPGEQSFGRFAPVLLPPPGLPRPFDLRLQPLRAEEVRPRRPPGVVLRGPPDEIVAFEPVAPVRRRGPVERREGLAEALPESCVPVPRLDPLHQKNAGLGLGPIPRSDHGRNQQQAIPRPAAPAARRLPPRTSGPLRPHPTSERTDRARPPRAWRSRCSRLPPGSRGGPHRRAGGPIRRRRQGEQARRQPRS